MEHYEIDYVVRELAINPAYIHSQYLERGYKIGVRPMKATSWLLYGIRRYTYIGYSTVKYAY